MNRIFESRFLTQYGTVVALLLLCVWFSVATLDRRHPTDPGAGRRLAEIIAARFGRETRVVIIVRNSADDRAFATALRDELDTVSIDTIGVVHGSPADARTALERFGASGTRIDLVATHYFASQWGVFQPAALRRLGSRHASFSSLKVIRPPGYRWPTFLSRSNLLFVVNQIAVIAIIAIGMTMVIVTAGIDLSVGSLIALSGVITAWSIRELAGGANASVLAQLTCCLIAIGACALFGLFSAVMVTQFNVPAFIVTLGVMLMARGSAFIIADGPSPIGIEAAAFERLSGGADFAGIPNPVVLMLLLYVAAWILMSKTALGRYIYAVGGNPEAARLSGVPVKRVLLFVYVVCGALAGLGGVVDASLFNVGNPNSGVGYELQIIAAVVVGGTSLAGGEGRIMGTLAGALILAVIRNGMYLTKVDSYRQMVVFGMLILAAVLLDQLKTRTRPGGRLA